MASIHPSAIVAPEARIAETAEIGPFCVVGENVVLEDNVVLKSNVVINGYTTVGAGTQVFPFACLGEQPQDLKYKGGEVRLQIGKNTVIREHVTMHPGTEGGGALTTIGDNCMFMVGAHVAHDCHLGNNVIMINNSALGGHVYVGDFAILGGLSAIHQFVRIGKHAMIGGASGVENDVIPFGSVTGNRARLSGLNIVGLKRRGFSRDDIHSLRTAYRILFANEGTIAERIEDVAALFQDNAAVSEVIGFMRSSSAHRSLCQP